MSLFFGAGPSRSGAFGMLRWPLFRFSSRTVNALRWIVGGVAGPILAGFGVLALCGVLLATYFVWGPYACISTVQKRIHDLSGFDFEISKRFNCDAAISVVVSKPGEAKKALLFEFPPPDDGALPTIASMADGTVQISIPRVEFIYCQIHKWDSLVVKYDIGVVDFYPRIPAEC